MDSAAPILFLEPSCYSMFAEDYAELGLDSPSERSFLFEHFLETLLEKSPDALLFGERRIKVAIHAHCHAKAITDVSSFSKLAARVPGASPSMLKTGCCGMAGAFGAMSEKYDLSVKVAAPLVDLVNALPDNASIIASGTSCRHQIGHLCDRTPIHMAEFLAEALS